MGIITTLFIGMLSSIFATVILTSICVFVRSVMIPWYADNIYHGVRIDGEWEFKGISGSEIGQNQNISFKLTLKQKSDKITGSLFTSLKKDDEISEYILDGKIRDMYFLATAIPKSNRNVDGTSLLLHVSYDDSQLIMSGGILVQEKPGVVVSHDDIKFVWKNSKTDRANLIEH